MLHKKHFDDILPVSTPADPPSVLGIGIFLDEAPDFLFPCKQIVGSLQFAMIGTRLDIVPLLVFVSLRSAIILML